MTPPTPWHHQHHDTTNTMTPPTPPTPPTRLPHHTTRMTQTNDRRTTMDGHRWRRRGEGGLGLEMCLRFKPQVCFLFSSFFLLITIYNRLRLPRHMTTVGRWTVGTTTHSLPYHPSQRAAQWKGGPKWCFIVVWALGIFFQQWWLPPFWGGRFILFPKKRGPKRAATPNDDNRRLVLIFFIFRNVFSSVINITKFI